MTYWWDAFNEAMDQQRPFSIIQNHHTVFFFDGKICIVTCK